MTTAAVPPPLPRQKRAFWWGVASLGFGGLALLSLVLCLLIGLGSVLHTIFPLLLLSPPSAEGPHLRTPVAASSLGRGRTSTSSLFLAPNARKSGATGSGNGNSP